MLYFCRINTLAFAKHGDEQWVLVKTDKLLRATMSYAGRFYGVTTDAVMAVDTRGGSHLPPRLVVAARLAKPFSPMADSVHLVENGEDGGLVLVHNKLYHQLSDDEEDLWSERKYEAYRVDLDAGKAIRVCHLGGRAVFIGCYRALSVSAQTFPCISADTIYPGADLVATSGAYSLKDGSFEPSSYGTRIAMAHPLSITDLLSTYVTQYTWLL